MEEPRQILISDFDYPLPDERIAKHPLARRDACKLLVAEDEVIRDCVFSELPSLLPKNAVLVYNNTRVINARIRFHKSTGGAIEVFCLEPIEPADYAQNFAATEECTWLCFVGNSKKWKEGELSLELSDGSVLKASRGSAVGNAWQITFRWIGGASFSEIIAMAGEIPVPPYLNRATEEADSSDYQTVYSHIEGSVAAPTAGLHFTDAVLDEIDKRGVQRVEVTLHVGAGTFQPVKSESIADHSMHSEFIAVRKDAIMALREAVKTERPIIAVGTTSVRTLESLYHAGCMIREGRWSGSVAQWYPYGEGHPRLSAVDALDALIDFLDKEGMPAFIADTQIIIAPGYEFMLVSGMVTNFHQPRSTLLLLISAFLGGGRWREIYEHALRRDYRFLSYGDACLFL